MVKPCRINIRIWIFKISISYHSSIETMLILFSVKKNHSTFVYISSMLKDFMTCYFFICQFLIFICVYQSISRNKNQAKYYLKQTRTLINQHRENSYYILFMNNAINAALDKILFQMVISILHITEYFI